jgi:putative protease
MIDKKNTIELLAPAGDLEKLKIAIEYGADAVYLGGENFGLRAGSKNFTISDIEEGVEFAHTRNKKVYLALNIFAHNEDINLLEAYLRAIKHIQIDAYIVSDPGIIQMLKSELNNPVIHLSTQANTTNYKSAEFWHNQGVKRIVLARELSFKEIKELREKTSNDLEIEAFVHGAMCISYSGRCLLSNFMVQRDANRGECAHPCRWSYSLMEEKRPNEYYPITEDERGSYIFNSKDLCLIEHIPAFVDVGITSLKIEGRMKSVFYLAIVIGAYRKAIDHYYEFGNMPINEELVTEINKASNRNYTTGFYLDKTTESSQNYTTSSYSRDYSFLGIIRGYDKETGLATVEQRNKFSVGDEIEIFGPNDDFFSQIIEEIIDIDGELVASAPHAQQMVAIKVIKPIGLNYMLRKQIKEDGINGSTE